MNDKPSTRYQDYFIREGQFIGRFEDMYRHSANVPWHQDETAQAIFSDVTVSILKHQHVRSMLDVGCGLGYMADRLRREIPELHRVLGIDVSETAIARAKGLFPEIEFQVQTVAGLDTEEQFDVVVSKDVTWCVMDDLPGYLSSLCKRSARWVYFANSFPVNRPFYGEHILPDAVGLFAYLTALGYRLQYSNAERDADYGGREYAHALIEVA